GLGPLDVRAALGGTGRHVSDAVQFQPNRKVLYVRCLGSLVFLIPAATLALVLFRAGEDLLSVAYVFVTVIFAIGVLSLLYTVFQFPTIRYEITAQQVINSHGLFWKVKRSTPLDKITNVDVRQGPIDRWLGVG